MAVISYKQFSGEIPNSEPQLLPGDRAQMAKNCEFTNGALQPMRDGVLLQTMLNNPVRGIYTEDGISFYTWSVETQAFKSPVTGDTNRRVYYLTPSVGKFNVSTTLGMAYNGPTPLAANTWKAGVPRPSVAPTLTLVKRTTLADYPSAGVKIDVWWEYGGTQYGKISPGFNTVTPFTVFTFTPPAFVSGSMPDGATLTAKISFVDGANNNAEIMAMTIKSGTNGRSSALPGGLEASLETSGKITISWGVIDTRAYVYTYRNDWKEEGANSPAALVSPTYMDDVQIGVTLDSFAGYRPFLDFKVYRTYGSNPTYVGVNVSGSGQILVDASNRKSVVGAALESTDWTPPPDGLQGLALMPNGWFAAFKDNTLYMSEPYRPHAWPYSISFAKGIRGIAVAQQSLVVTTADGVHVVTGAFPAAAQQMRLNSPQPGIAQRSMTPVDGAIAYASNDGIVFVEGADATISVSQKLFTRAKWRERFSSVLSDGSLTFAYHDGCLVGSSPTASEGFTLRLDEDVGALCRIDAGFGAMFFLPVTDSLYYSVGANVYLFKGGINKTMDWWGKDWVYPQHSTFGAAYIRCDGPTTITLYADGDQVYSTTQSTGHFRLPSLPRALRWSVRFSGAYTVSEFSMAQSMLELKSV